MACHCKPPPTVCMTRRMIAHYRTGSRAIPRVVGLACKGWEAGAPPGRLEEIAEAAYEQASPGEVHRTHARYDTIDVETVTEY